jgi:hypothetical protein
MLINGFGLGPTLLSMVYFSSERFEDLRDCYNPGDIFGLMAGEDQ